MVATTPVLGEQRVILQNISWQCFEYLLEELGEHRSARLAYDQGVLEIMSPFMPHEHVKRLIEKFIDALADDLDLPIRSAGSLTCKRKDLGRGIEPDSGFYIQTEPLIRHLEHIDMMRPPPDLMLEVDFSSDSLNKEPIYLALGVPEFWRYAKGELTIKQLRQGRYVSLDHSPTFANLPLTEIPQFLSQSTQLGERGVVKVFRAWVQECLQELP